MVKCPLAVRSVLWVFLLPIQKCMNISYPFFNFYIIAKHQCGKTDCKGFEQMFDEFGTENVFKLELIFNDLVYISAYI